METAHRLPRFFVLWSTLVWVVAWGLWFAVYHAIAPVPPSPVDLRADPDRILAYTKQLTLIAAVVGPLYRGVGIALQAAVVRAVIRMRPLEWVAWSVLLVIAYVAIDTVLNVLSTLLVMALPFLAIEIFGSEFGNVRGLFAARDVFRIAAGLVSGLVFAAVFAARQSTVLRRGGHDAAARAWRRSAASGWAIVAFASVLAVILSDVARLLDVEPLVAPFRQGLAVAAQASVGLLTGLALKHIVEAAPAPAEATPAPVDIEA